MAAPRGPAARLLIAPAILLAVLVAGLHALHAASLRDTDPALLLDDLPLIAGEPVRCEREREDTDPGEDLAERFDPAGRVSSAMIVACPRAFDGRRVRYVGELVGDVLHRDGGAWTQVNDDDYALEVGPLPAHGDHRGANSGLAVWIPDAFLDGLEPGRHGRRGDVVEIQGVVLRADPDDGGGLTVRTNDLHVLAEATDVPIPVDLPQAVLAAVVCLLAGGIWLLRWRESR
ncbi:hypothetical protein [Egicoccus sp. AB-alg2]|uniref:hypothetical protein n=1 Tax=Egicoccus sp. AB-alg2 TaxID=3242693 RepID=UPI00359E8429